MTVRTKAEWLRAVRRGPHEGRNIAGKSFRYPGLPKTVGSQDRVDIECPDHGVWNCLAFSRMKHGCPICARITRAAALRGRPSRSKMSVSALLQGLRGLHKKVDYTKVTSYTNNRDILRIRCTRHNEEFSIKLFTHLYDRVRGCAQCRTERVAAVQIDLKRRYVSRLQKLNAKRKRTNLREHGVAWPTQRKDVLTKRARNHERKYGCTNPSQRPEVQRLIAANRSTSEHKTLRVRGKLYTSLQGYEPKAVRYMIRQGLPARILDKPKMAVPYVGHDGKQHFYHPDFHIAGSRVEALVEVKSTYTCGLQAVPTYYHSYDTLVRKSDAVISLGYEFILLVMQDKSDEPLLEWVGKLPRKSSNLSRYLKKSKGHS